MEWRRRPKKQAQAQAQPRLERLNAKKGFNYQPPPSPPSPSSTSSSSHFDRQTSFRLFGVDGEFDRIFQTLGLSGPEDFAIPTADWEARKARVASSKAPGPTPTPNALIHSSTEIHPLSVTATSATTLQDDVVSVHVSVMGSSPWSSGEHDAGRGSVGRLRNGERSVLFTDSGSFTTSHDDDSDIGGERVSSVSISAAPDELVVPFVSSFSFEWFRRTFSSWQKGDVLGNGSFGTVYEGFTDEGFFFAVKEVSLLDEGNQGKQSIFQLQQEISLLSKFEHKNIVRYYGSDKDKSKLYIFLELMSKGSLASLYQKYRLNDSQVSAYTRQILCGLKYLHDHNVVHRDIKCANILVDVSGAVKLADFGLAKATKFNDVRSSKGSPYWMAPEVVNLRDQGGYGLAADIWSLGCTVLEMLTRQPPYSDLEGMQALFRIGKGELPSIPDYLSKDAQDFIRECLQINPNKRPTAAQLLDHPFLRRTLLSPLSFASPQRNMYRS
ncbi:mitogen-activated protein kinase kinase kinase 1 [Vigna radiata var. radiata]|uniref:mitogen-activated protein kinase kinase kinase n=1 Tax=Vigna radiata var. radiata TaxID=3916 RepID=A0A1S3T8P1_VIGRR|nr:mitogen-activated protein kinase kinase kinase 1 [Vigna radiata var. radiata]